MGRPMRWLEIYRQAGDLVGIIHRAYDAMTSDRPYRPALDSETALQNLQENAGTQLDPTLVDAYLRALQQPAQGRRHTC